MKSFLKSYRHLIALALVLTVAISGVALGVIRPGAAFLTVGLWQLAQFAISKRQAGVFFISGLTTNQINEFEKCLREIESEFPKIKGLSEKMGTLEKLYDNLHGEVRTLRKSGVHGGQRGVSFTAAGVPQVTEECAKHLGSMFVIKAVQDNKIKGSQAEELLLKAAEFMGMETKAAIAVGDIPLPVGYGAQIVELVYIYGAARKNCTVYPLSTNSMKLPRLKTGEPQFGFIAISGAVGEKVPQMEFITFTPGKAGGIIRIPSEIDADSIASIGQFVARYIAREMAVWEDTCLFLGDGTSTYNSIQGVGKQSTTDGNVLQLTAGNSSSDKITLANIRGLRTKVSGAVLKTAKYYAHPTMEACFIAFNTSATVVPYVRNSDGTATFDGFPIEWVSIMPVYSTTATLNAYQILFGDLSWWYFGERKGIDVMTSRDIYFTTDEIGIRALERFDIHGMGQNSTAAMQLSAS